MNLKFVFFGHAGAKRWEGRPEKKKQINSRSILTTLGMLVKQMCLLQATSKIEKGAFAPNNWAKPLENVPYGSRLFVGPPNGLCLRAREEVVWVLHWRA